jgi:hypothetical protein
VSDDTLQVKSLGYHDADDQSAAIGDRAGRKRSRRILALTDELKQRARAMANPEEAKIRNRAREIWEENGRPAGRDKEFWFQAEREFREAEDLAKRSGADV